MRETRRLKYVLAASLFVGSAALAGAVQADTSGTGKMTGHAPASANMDRRMMVSDEGFKAERDIGAARIAIFDGQVEHAKALVKDAQAELATVASHSASFANTTGEVPNAPADTTKPADTQKPAAATPTKVDMVPFEGRMIVADNMVATPDKTEKVKQADASLKAGDSAKAMDILKQGAVDVAFSRLMMPLDATMTHVTEAETLLKQDKYYEASLALKAAQDLVQTDTVDFIDPSAQAAKLSGLPAATPAPTAAKK